MEPSEGVEALTEPALISGSDAIGQRYRDQPTACAVMLGAPLCVEDSGNRPEGWGTDPESVPQPFGRQARMPGGGTWPRGPVLPRPRRNGRNRTRSNGTPDCHRGRTPSVHMPRRTPWFSRPVPRVEGARCSVSLDCHPVL